MKFIKLLLLISLSAFLISCKNKKDNSNNMPPINELTYSSELQLSALNEAIEADPNNDYLYFKRADYFHGINNFRIAQNDIAKALRLDANVSSYWLLSAKINNELENIDQALSEAQKALELGNKEPIVYALLANCLLEKNDTITANQYIYKLSSLAPQMAELNYIEAKKSILKKDTLQSFLKYKLCIQKNPQFIEAYIDLMSLYYEKHMYDSIMPLLIKAKRMRPCKPELFLYEGKFFESINKGNVAFAAYKEGLLCDPQAFILYKPLSEYYQKTLNYKEAMTYLGKWLERNPTDSKSIIKMGDYSLKLDDSKGALIYYKNGVSLDTGNVFIKKEIDKIEKSILLKTEVKTE